MTDDARAVRALTDVIAAEEVAPGLMRVVTWSDEYYVDARDGGCLCPDKEYHDAAICKHEYSALVADVDRLPTPYVQNIEDRPTALADGGEPCEECAALPGDWECWPCAAANEIGVES